MRMIDFTLIGTIVPLTPINISRPDSKDDPHAGVPMITVTGRGGRRQLPHVPGETYKGMLRAAAADLATRGRKLDLTLYNTLYKGGIKGSEKEAVDDLRKTATFRNSNPVLGLFGASAPRWVHGCLSVGPSMPASEEEVAVTSSNGMRMDDFRRDPERLGRLDPKSVEGYMEYSAVVKEVSQTEAENERLGRENYKLKNPRDGAKEPDAAERIAANLKTIKENDVRLKALRENEHYKNTIGRPLPFKNGIAPGSILHQRICGTALTDVEFGLFLDTLRQLRHRCRIGGLDTIGYGFYKADWRLSVMEDGEDDFSDAGTVRLAPNEFSLESKHPAVARALAAWRETGDSVAPLDTFLKAEA